MMMLPDFGFAFLRGNSGKRSDESRTPRLM
jgi:hypothetical protein